MTEFQEKELSKLWQDHKLNLATMQLNLMKSYMTYLPLDKQAELKKEIAFLRNSQILHHDKQEKQLRKIWEKES